jgi:hypothetical protein
VFAMLPLLHHSWSGGVVAIHHVGSRDASPTFDIRTLLSTHRLPQSNLAKSL